MNKNQRRKILIAFLFASIICVPLTIGNASAAATLTPASASTVLDAKAQFVASGLDSSDTYYVKVGSTQVLSALSATSSGTLTFEVSSSVAGTYTVGVYNSTDDLQCSAQLIVSDILTDMMPYIVLLVSFVIVFGVVKQLKF